MFRGKEEANNNNKNKKKSIDNGINESAGTETDKVSIIIFCGWGKCQDGRKFGQVASVYGMLSSLRRQPSRNRSLERRKHKSHRYDFRMDPRYAASNAARAGGYPNSYPPHGSPPSGGYPLYSYPCSVGSTERTNDGDEEDDGDNDSDCHFGGGHGGRGRRTKNISGSLSLPDSDAE